MARHLDDDDDGDNVYANHTKQALVPIRWMSPEQLKKHVYSKASDVYAFGVVLFEIWARESPWKGVADVVVATSVESGETLSVPASAPAAVQQLMHDCWRMRASKRPSMNDVQMRLTNEMDNIDSSDSSSLYR